MDRLQKIISRAGLASRRQAEEWIRQGRVRVDGETATVGQKAHPDENIILVDGARLELPSNWRYLLMYKPDGMICTRSDPAGRPTVYQLLPAHERRGLRSVGRLDYHTEGLLLFTDDGDLAQRLLHPRYGCSKTYEVKVSGEPSLENVQKLRDGIVLQGRRTAPARIHAMDSPGPRGTSSNSWWRIELQEGKNRQIREMFDRIGHPVQRLRRVALGPLRDTRLARGETRRLTADEVGRLRRSTGVASKQGSSGKQKRPGRGR